MRNSFAQLHYGIKANRAKAALKWGKTSALYLTHANTEE